MTRDTPIFRQLEIEQRFRPFDDLTWPEPSWWNLPTACPICGVVDCSQFAVEQYDDPICQECWFRKRHLQPQLWHCADCGVFLPGLNHYVLRDGSEVIHLCRQHFEARCTCAMSEASMMSCRIHIHGPDVAQRAALSRNRVFIRPFETSEGRCS